MHRINQRRWDDARSRPAESRPRTGPTMNPLTRALDLLNGSPSRGALIRAVEDRVKAHPEERRRFSAAVGRVRGMTGEQALIQAVRNYLEDLSRSDGDGASGPVWLMDTLAALTGGRARQSNVTANASDPRAAAEALFKPRTVP